MPLTILQLPLCCGQAGQTQKLWAILRLTHQSILIADMHRVGNRFPRLPGPASASEDSASPTRHAEPTEHMLWLLPLFWVFSLPELHEPCFFSSLETANSISPAVVIDCPMSPSTSQQLFL